MKRCGIVLAGLALLPLTPGAAQVPAEQDAADRSSEIAPEDDLDCAMFTAYIFGTQHELLDEQAKIGIAASMAYFIGRWEAATGGDLKGAMTARGETLTLAEIGGLGQECGGRMQSLGERMQIAGGALAEVASDPEDAKNSPPDAGDQ